MSQAHIAAFKSQTLALIETLRLKPSEVVGLGLTLAASYALGHGISRAAVAEALGESFENAEASRPGIVEPRVGPSGAAEKGGRS
jgi:hypothetical protein